MNNFLEDKDFLDAVNHYAVKQYYTKLEILDWQETTLSALEGIVTSGSIAFAKGNVRRTLSLTVILHDENGNLTNIDNPISINKKIKCSLGLTNPFAPLHQDLAANQQEYGIPPHWATYPETLWFKQGIFYITEASSQISTGGVWTISLKCIDKMAGLNGTIGGTFPAAMVLHEQLNIADNGDIILEYPLIRDIIQELVQHFGGEDPGRIIINDVPLNGRRVIKYAGTEPLYMNVDPTNWSASFKLTYDANYFPVLTGQKCGYRIEGLTYPGELTFNAGATVTQALDSIVNLLGNYQYYYDVDGNFRWEYLNIYNQTGATPLAATDMDAGSHNLQFRDYLPIYSDTEFLNTFRDASLITQLSINPKYANIKNDFMVWGNVGSKSGDGKDQVRYHLTIDKRPQLTINSGQDSTRNPQVADEGLTHSYDSLSTKYVYVVKKDQGKDGDGKELYGQVIRYIFTDTSQTAAQLSAALTTGEKIDPTLNMSPTWDAGNGKSALLTENTFEWREELYRQALMRWNTSGWDTPYDAELIAEWRKLYNVDNKEYQTQWNTKNAAGVWGNQPTGEGTLTYGVWTSWGTWKGYNPDVVENPEKINYWLDIIDDPGEISKYSIPAIGRRSVTVTNERVNSVFRAEIPDLVFFENPGDNAKTLAKINEMVEQGQRFCMYLPAQAYLFENVNYYGSCFETLRGLLFKNLQYNISISMTTIPVLYLDVNKMIYLDFPNLGVQDYFIIDSFSLNLGNSATMSLSAHQAEIIA